MVIRQYDSDGVVRGRAVLWLAGGLVYVRFASSLCECFFDGEFL